MDELTSGDVRVTSPGAVHLMAVEVWDGAAWLPLRRVSSLAWTIDAASGLPALAIRILAPQIALTAPVEAPAPDEQPGPDTVEGG